MDDLHNSLHFLANVPFAGEGWMRNRSAKVDRRSNRRRRRRRASSDDGDGSGEESSSSEGGDDGHATSGGESSSSSSTSDSSTSSGRSTSSISSATSSSSDDHDSLSTTTSSSPSSDEDVGESENKRSDPIVSRDVRRVVGDEIFVGKRLTGTKSSLNSTRRRRRRRQRKKKNKRFRLIAGDKQIQPVVPRAKDLDSRHWEHTLVRRGIMNGRIFFSPSTSRGPQTARGYPTAVFSLIPYDGSKKGRAHHSGHTPARGKRNDDEEYDENGDEDGKRRHFLHLLHASWGRCSWIRDQRDEHPVYNERPYRPDFLDDPEIRQSKQRTVMHLPSYLQTVIPYVRQGELEEQLNSQFRQLHPWIELELTLSKIRRLKRQTVQLALAVRTRGDLPGLELSTVALSHVLFEKLVLRRHVNTENYRVVMGSCLLLAFKFNEPRASCFVGRFDESVGDGDYDDDNVGSGGDGGGDGGSASAGEMKDDDDDKDDEDDSTYVDEMPQQKAIRMEMLARMVEYLSVNVKEVIGLEFTVYRWLRFELHVPTSEIEAHFRRILKSLREGMRTPKTYLRLVEGEVAFYKELPSEFNGDLGSRISED